MKSETPEEFGTWFQDQSTITSLELCQELMILHLQHKQFAQQARALLLQRILKPAAKVSTRNVPREAVASKRKSLLK